MTAAKHNSNGEDNTPPANASERGDGPTGNAHPSLVRLLTLARSDQAALALAAAVALVAIAAVAIYQGAPRGDLIDIDRAEPLEYRFAVDINQADWPELVPLPGIGETLARRIVEHRAAHGPFLEHDRLTDVKGIGPKTLEKLRPHLLPLPDAENVASTPANANES